MCILWYKTETLLKGVFQLGELVGGYSGIYEQNENRFEVLSSAWKDVLNGCKVRHKLSRELLRSDVGSVVLWEIVFVLTRGTSPILEPKVHFCVGVQNSLACFAGYRGVLHQGHILNFFHGGVHTSHWNDDARGSNLIARPEVPAEPDSILELSLVEVHLNILL